MTKQQFIKEWEQFGKNLINEEQPENSITNEDWKQFGRIMYQAKTKCFPNRKLEDLIPLGTECRQYPRAFVELKNPFSLAIECGILYENWVNK